MFGISVDSPGQNSAMIEKLGLGFPILSDPDRSRAISPFGLADEADPREIALPAVVVLGPGGEEAFRFVSRDFADRVPEEVLLDRLRRLEHPPTSQEPPELGPLQPGPKAMPFESLFPYLRGARFAVVAMSRRHGAIKEDAAAYIEQMDRYIESVQELHRAKAGRNTA